MPDPAAQAATQLANIVSSTGRSVEEWTEVVRATGLEKHGQIVSMLKADHGLTHGNANLLAATVRDALAGGPAGADDLFAAQYAGTKAALLPIHDAVAAVADALGDDVDRVVQKTGVSYRRAKQFLLVQAPSAKRVQLGLNLPSTPDDDRVRETTGMCSHRVDVTSADEVDDALSGWIAQAYDAAG
jgi:predicted transport protein